MMKIDLLNYFVGAFTTLFSVVNPLGMVPIFLALTASDSNDYRRYQAKKACFYMVAILAFFLFAGSFFMRFFGISLESLRIAGGLIVLRSGFMLLNSKDKPNISKQATLEALEKPDISLTPLAMPLLSGPGSIAATITLATQTRGIAYTLMILSSIILVGAISYLILRVSQRLLPILGSSGIEATSKIMGFIAMTVGVQFIINGVESFIKKVGVLPL